MRKSPILWGFIFVAALITFKSNAQELRTYRSAISVSIQDNDIAYARTSAFQKLRFKLLEIAILDLMGTALYEEHYWRRHRKEPLTPEDFLASYHVTHESIEEQTFTMELEAKIQISVLAEKLRKMNLILKDDPWYPVTLLIDDHLSVTESTYMDRLRLFHIDTTITKLINLSDFYWQDANNKFFIETLFNEFPQNRIIFLIDAMMAMEEESESIEALHLKVFRKTDLKLITSQSVSVSPGLLINDEDFNKLLLPHLKRLLSRLTLQSLGISQFDSGFETVFFLKVKGIQQPFLRSRFEHYVLKGNRTIISFSLNRLSGGFTEYRLESNTSLVSLYKSLQIEDPNFHVNIVNGTADSLEIEVIPKTETSAVDLSDWQPDEMILDTIKMTLKEENLLMDLEEEYNLSDEYFPKLIEREPNNNRQNLNVLPPATQILGRISNRADEDIFQLQCNQKMPRFHNESQFMFEGDSATTSLNPLQHIRSVDTDCSEMSSIFVEWLRIGKTTLSPQIRLYDQNFNFLIAYTLIGSQHRLIFRHSFDGSQPEAVYLRISDKIGFIPGETGGSKYFDYLLKFRWQ